MIIDNVSIKQAEMNADEENTYQIEQESSVTEADIAVATEEIPF
mgnify:CR=1 FL=1